MPYRIDAAVNAVQAACTNALTNAVPSDADFLELPPVHYTVLVRCKLCDPPIDGRWVAFCTHTVQNAPHP